MTVLKYKEAGVWKTLPLVINSSVPMDTWHLVGAAGEPAFVVPFANYDPSGSAWQRVGFRKDPLGRVHLKGLLGATATATVGQGIFALPAGYWPPKPIILDTSVGGTFGFRLDVTSGGGVIYNTSGQGGTVGLGSFITLDGLSFDTESVTQMPTGPQGPPGPGVRGLVTTLPSNPQDGDECYYIPPSDTDTLWHLRFNAGWHALDGKGWVFLGGNPMFRFSGSGVAYVTGAGYTFGPAMAAPQLTVPFAGTYRIEYGVTGQSTTAAADWRAVPFGNGSGTGVTGLAGATSSTPAMYNVSIAGAFPGTVPAGYVLDLRVAANIASAAITIYDRFLQLTPVRVG